MRRKTTVFLITTSITTALMTAMGDLAAKSFICESSECVKIHSSSFGSLFYLPIGFYAAAFLSAALWLYWRGKTNYAGILLCGLLGVETYFTFIQVVFIRSICTTCLIFFSLLFACVILSRMAMNRNAAIAGFMMFFAAHFYFFFPNVSLKPTLLQDPAQATRQIEIFASPTCPHCEKAIAALRGVCEIANARLIVRPVSISKADTKKSIEWVSGKLFSCNSPISYRLAERIVWDNETAAKQLDNGRLAVPLILIRRNREKELFKGWNNRVQQAVFAALGISRPKIMATGNLLTRNKEIMCTVGASSCEK